MNGEAELTCDALLRGRLRVFQPKKGARVTLDSLLLADFAAGGRARLGRVLDLGCGGGVIALALGQLDPEARLVGVELQPELAALARKNADLNGLADRLEVVAGDVTRPRALPLRPGTFDLVVSNPPFHEVGRTPPAPERALARHELACTLDDVIAAARRFIKPRGYLAVVFPAERLPDLLGTLVTTGLRPRTVRPVHSVADEPARRVLVLAMNGYKGGVTVSPPLVIHRPDRRAYTDEVARILGDP